MFTGKFGRGWEVDSAYLVSGERAEKKLQVNQLGHGSPRLLEPALAEALG